MQEKYDKFVLETDLRDSEDPRVRQEVEQRSGPTMNERFKDFQLNLKMHKNLIRSVHAAVEFERIKGKFDVRQSDFC